MTSGCTLLILPPDAGMKRLFESHLKVTNIKMAMGKAWNSQFEIIAIERLTLYFVDNHGKAKHHWELNPLIFKREICLLHLK